MTLIQKGAYHLGGFFFNVGCKLMAYGLGWYRRQYRPQRPTIADDVFDYHHHENETRWN
jgi:hypothetical protein